MDSSVGEQSPINASDNTDYPVAKDRYGDQITYDGNPACLPGIMHDVNKWIERTGHFKLLFEQYAVPLSNGALAIDQPDNIQFIEQRLPNAEVHDFFNPCPPTLKRFAQYNIKAVNSTPRLLTATPTNSPVPKEQSRNYTVVRCLVRLPSSLRSCALPFLILISILLLVLHSKPAADMSLVAIQILIGPSRIPHLVGSYFGKMHL